MRCYFAYDNGNKVLIPGCWSTVHSDDIEDCTCADPMTDYSFEKNRFNDAIQEKNQIISKMQCEINELKTELKRLKG